MRTHRRQDDDSAPKAKQQPLLFGDPESIERMHGRGIESPAPRQKPTETTERSAIQQGVLFVRRILSLVPFAGAAYIIFAVVTNVDPLTLEAVFWLIVALIILVGGYFAILQEVIDWDFLFSIKDRLSAAFGVQSSERDVEWGGFEAVPGIDYYEYLESNEWKQRRDYMVRRAGFRCERCSREGRLEVHHRTYKRLGNERLEDLVVLCPDCHELVHSQGMIDR